MADSPVQDIPHILTVQVPAGRPIRFGVHATTHHEAHRQMIRYANFEWTAIEKWANILNITPTHFVRDAANNMVAALEKLEELHNANSKHSGGG